MNVLTGDPKAGEIYFNGAGKCSSCHSPTGDLAGIAKKYDPPVLQLKVVFPETVAFGRRMAAGTKKPVTVTVTPLSGPPVTGVLLRMDDFNVSLTDQSGEYRSFARAPGVKVEKNDPYAAHIALLDQYTDKEIHDVDANIQSLSLDWIYRINSGEDRYGGVLKATPLVVNGIMYFTVPDKVWAIDARTGREIWKYTWPSKGGIHLGNRGVGISGNRLYFETPDCNLVSLDLKDGKLRWSKSICDLNQMYYASVAPVVIKNHVIVGVSGDDLDIPGYLESRDLETGELQWRWSTVPKPGEPGSETWPSADAMEHGGGMTWVPCTYDPELNMVFVGTGNPQPVIAGKGRKGSNLFTESIVALSLDTGKMVWHFQPSPHDTHGLGRRANPRFNRW